LPSSGPDPTNLVSLSDFAQRFGVTVGAVTNWRARLPDFPDPVDASAKRPRYDQRELLEWCRANSRVPTTRGDAKLSPLFFAATDPNPKARQRPAGEALALVAIETLRIISPAEVDDPADVLRPALHLVHAIDRSDLYELRTVLQQRVNRSPRLLVDELRDDFAALADDFGWAERTAVADIASSLVGHPESAIDPCCGNGSLLAAVGRASGKTARLTGVEFDPIRAASAYALLRCESLNARILVGDAFESVGLFRSHQLLIASPPAGPSQQKTNHQMHDWVEMCTTQAWLEGTDRAVLVLPTSWTLHRQPSVADPQGDLLINDALRCAVTLSPAGSQRSKSITVVELDNSANHVGSALMIDAAGLSDSMAHRLVKKCLKARDKGPKPSKHLPSNARMLSLESLLAKGTIAPDSFTRGGSSDRTHRALPSVPLLPQPALGDLQSFLQQIRRPPRRRTPGGGRWLGDLAYDALIEVGDPADLMPELQPVVTVGTTSANFGEVHLIRPGESLNDTTRRGLVGLRVLPAGDVVGLTPEFLATWLASDFIQSVLEAKVGHGKVRRSLSRNDILSLPAEFPDRRRQEAASVRWERFQELSDFHRQLGEALVEWKLHLIDDIKASTNED
jgi:hypothetical protein